MAKELQEVWTDDLTGDPAIETVAFTINGDEYRIDLSEENSQKFWSTWSPWLRVAQRVTRRRRRRSSSRGPGVVTDPVKVRGWAKSMGIQVNSQGYPRNDVQRQYLLAWLNNEVPKEYA